MQKDSKIEVDFGFIVEQIRKESRQSQRQFADRLGIQPNTYCNIAMGLHMPNVMLAYKMCKFLGISLDSVCDLVSKNIVVDNEDALFDVLRQHQKEFTEKNIKKWRRAVEHYDNIEYATKNMR